MLLAGGSDMGEDEAEEQRLTLITRLLSNSAVIDYDGAVQVQPHAELINTPVMWPCHRCSGKNKR